MRERLATADLEEDLELLGRKVDLARRTVHHAQPDPVVGIEIEHAAGFAKAKFGLGDERSDFESERRRSLGKHDVVDESECSFAPGQNHSQDVRRISRAARLGPDDMSVAQRQPRALAARFGVEGPTARTPTEESEEFTRSEMMKASLQDDAHWREFSPTAIRSSATGPYKRRNSAPLALTAFRQAEDRHPLLACGFDVIVDPKVRRENLQLMLNDE